MESFKKDQHYKIENVVCLSLFKNRLWNYSWLMCIKSYSTNLRNEIAITNTHLTVNLLSNNDHGI